MSTFYNNTTYRIAKTITQIRIFVQWKTWHLEITSSRVLSKIGCEDNMIATIPITEGTSGNVQK